MRPSNLMIRRACVVTLGCVLAACGGDDTHPAAGGGGAGGAGASGGSGATGGSSGGSGGSVAPGDLPLLDATDLVYEGAFRLPADDFGVSSMNFSEGPLAYRAATDSIVVVGHDHQQAIAEFAVPAIQGGTSLADLPMAAAPQQGFVTVLDRVAQNPQALDQIAGLALFDGPSGQELLIHAYEYYDAPADNTHTTLVLRDASKLASATVDGFYSFGGAAHAAGWISPVPSEWQPLLGGPALSGASSGVPIISRLSVGPSAFAFDPADLVGSSAPPGPISTTALLDFSLDEPLHADLDNASKSNDLWTHLSRAVYGFIAPGTRTYVTLGSSGGHGTGVCYKCTPVGANEECGGFCANDVTDYANYYWLWDVNDLVKVKQGQLEPFAVRPYAHGAFATPFAPSAIGGGSFDPSSGRLYLTLQGADTAQGQYANPPVVVVYSLKAK